MTRESVPVQHRLLLTTSEAAALLGVSGETFREDVAPLLAGVMVRGRFRWPRAELDRWLTRHQRELLPRDLTQLGRDPGLPLPEAPPPFSDSHERLLLTTTEAAALLGMSRDVFRDIVASKIRSVPVRSTKRFSRAELEKWIGRAEGM